jgi:List-Bact-rpt repeat protein/Big-like domain-containing protein
MAMKVVRDGLRRTVLTLLLFVSAAIVQNSTFAVQNVTLSWTRSADPTATGYKVYYGVNSRIYTNLVSVGNVTNATVPRLVEGATYYFAATAYNTLGFESVYSGEITYTVPVAAGNQPPTLDAPGNVTLFEDEGTQTVNLTGITTGATNEFQTLTVTATSSRPTFIPNPTVTYTSPNNFGSLAFTPVANSNGTATITVTVNDGQAANNTIVRTFTVTVNPVNDTPTLNPINDVTVNEDPGPQSVSLTGINQGANNEGQTIVITAASSNPGLIPTPSINYNSPNATGTLNFTPVANSNGASTITVTLTDGGASNNIVVRTFNITVNAVNDLPTLGPIGNVVINEDATQQTVNLSGISSGAGNEPQGLVVTASSSDTSVIPHPNVTYSSPNATGSLTFTPVPGASGVATITVTVNDGAPSGNLFSRTFTVTVNGINDPPTLDAIANLSISQDAGQQAVQLTGISAGAGNEVQTLIITALSSNPGLIPTPTINYINPDPNGTLRFTPTTGGHGSATITVTVNDGQASSNTVQRSFNVSINGLPTISSIDNQIIVTNAGVGPLPFVVMDPETPAGSLSVTASSTAPSVIPVSNIVLGGSSSNRNVTITPLPNQSGVVDITLTVSDGTATASTTFEVTVLEQDAPPTGLTVVINGNGTITPDLTSTSLTPGKIYKVTAVPGDGQEFAGWSGTFSWPSADLTFLARSNLFLRANFVPSPYIPINGNYNGLFYEDSEVRVQSAGFFNVAVTPRGTYSGRLQLGMGRYSFKGKLSLNCKATNAMLLKDGTYLILKLRMGTNSQAGQAFGQLTDQGWVSSLHGDRTPYNGKTVLAPYAGLYTMAIPGDDTDPSVPSGHGYAAVVVSTAGVAAFAGSLADGTKVTSSAPLSQSGLWPLYASVYSGRGSVLSWISFTNRVNDDLNGALSWIKLTGGKSKYYAKGFTNNFGALGSTYTSPIGSNILNITSGEVAFVGGNLSQDFTNTITLGPGSKLMGSSGNGRALGLAFTLKSGTFKGSVTDPAGGKPLIYSGVVLEKSKTGYGYLLGTNQASQVLITP